jgi:hypothetical protein
MGRLTADRRLRPADQSARRADRAAFKYLCKESHCVEVEGPLHCSNFGTRECKKKVFCAIITIDIFAL